MIDQLKHVMFQWKRKKQYLCGRNIFPEGAFVTQMSSNAEIFS